MARFDEQQLPPRESFNSRLRDSVCSEADYKQAQDVWAKFNCRTMRDYHDIYLKTGYLIFFYFLSLLIDVFVYIF